MINEEQLQSLDRLFDWAIEEDLGDGDHTTLACIPENAKGQAILFAKEPGIIAGLPVAGYLFRKFDPQCHIQYHNNDGAEVQEGEQVFTIEGQARAILTAERTILNFLQRLSGIATQTARYAAIVQKYNVGIADTRKTTPGWRLLEKAAVKAGGGTNHRMGLYDLILIKDNHVDFAGGISEAVNSSVTYLKATNKSLKIEVEVRNFQELEEALQTGKVDIVMLDNFSPEDCRKAVQLINGRCEVEASGNIDLTNLEAYAATGIDYLSSGALTHSVKSLDLSLRAEF